MKNAGKACNNRLYRHIRTFEKIVKNYFVISKENKKSEPFSYWKKVRILLLWCTSRDSNPGPTD